MWRPRFPLVTREIYHIFNRSVGGQPIFVDNRACSRAIELINFYRFLRPSIRYSHYNRLSKEQKLNFWDGLVKNHVNQVEILAFCLMPNHFHFVLRQSADTGIIKFMNNFQNSYARYFNTKFDRYGSLFQARFKSVHIETDAQLLHVVRYVHLNPLTSFVLKDKSELKNYPWSSFKEYLTLISHCVETKTVLDLSYNLDKFEEFTFDQLSYQRELNEIKHLALE